MLLKRRRPWGSQPQQLAEPNIGHRATDGLLAWLPGNGNYVDPIRRLLLVPEVGGVGFVNDTAGRAGSVSAFDWSPASQSGVDGGSIPFLSEFTLCASVHVDDTGRADAYYNLISRGSVFSNNTNFSFGFRLLTGGTYRRPYCYARNGSTLVGSEGTTNVSVGWHRVVISWRSGAQTMYVDGASVWTATATNGADGSQKLYFGRPTTTGASELYWRNGAAFDLRVYGRAWTAADVADDYYEQHAAFARRIWVPVSAGGSPTGAVSLIHGLTRSNLTSGRLVA